MVRCGVQHICCNKLHTVVTGLRFIQYFFMTKPGKVNTNPLIEEPDRFCFFFFAFNKLKQLLFVDLQCTQCTKPGLLFNHIGLLNCQERQ